MKMPYLILFLLVSLYSVAQESDTVRQGVIKVRKLPEMEVEDSIDRRHEILCGYFQPFRHPFTFSAGYQQWEFGFAELGFWLLNDERFFNIRGMYIESDFKNTHALMLSASHPLIRYSRVHSYDGTRFPVDLISMGLDAGPVYDNQRMDAMVRPNLRLQLPGSFSYLHILGGYNFRLDQKGPHETNKFFLSARFYIP